MPDTEPAVDSVAPSTTDQAFTSVMEALVELMRSGVRPDVLDAQRVLLHRLATQGDVFPARIPAPRNITEIGGYLNLLEHAGQLGIRSAAVASALGVAGPPAIGAAAAVSVGFMDIPNDRPEGLAQASIPPQLRVRADFVMPLQSALATLHALGCHLPLRAPRAVLPLQVSGVPANAPDPDQIMAVLGRMLEVYPGTVLVDPALDALAVAHPESPAGEPMRLVARESGGGALVAEASWVAMVASADAAVASAPAARRYLEVAPIVAQAGWYHPTPLVEPASLSDRGTLVRLQNVTNLVAGETTLGAQLALLYPAALIARSTLAPFVTWIWTGSEFAASP
jgi:hypothetical protein